MDAATNDVFNSPHLLRLIFRYLKYPDLFRSGHVCQSFRNVIKLREVYNFEQREVACMMNNGCVLIHPRYSHIHPYKCSREQDCGCAKNKIGYVSTYHRTKGMIEMLVDLDPGIFIYSGILEWSVDNAHMGYVRECVKANKCHLLQFVNMGGASESPFLMETYKFVIDKLLELRSTTVYSNVGFRATDAIEKHVEECVDVNECMQYVLDKKAVGPNVELFIRSMPIVNTLTAADAVRMMQHPINLHKLLSLTMITGHYTIFEQLVIQAKVNTWEIFDHIRLNG